jgi:hypothetical protein
MTDSAAPPRLPEGLDRLLQAAARMAHDVTTGLYPCWPQQRAD